MVLGTGVSDPRYVYGQYFDMVYRICLMYFKGNAADAEDAAQTVFMKYIELDSRPENEGHTKAWLIVTAQNTCKSMLRRHFRKDVTGRKISHTGKFSQR